MANPLLIRREVTVQRTARFVQVCGKFDLPTDKTSVREWDVDLQLPPDWQVMVIVGPSMSGKSTIANELFPGELVDSSAGTCGGQGYWPWPADKCIADGFPAGMSIDEICGLLSSVGFSSPPDWNKPYAALSNGGKFRVDLARTLAERTGPGTPHNRAVIDEFGSLVHAQARLVAAAAAAKAVRRRGAQLVALLVHDDAVPYFEPDVVIRVEPGRKVTADVTRGLLRRPPIQFKIVRAHPSAWECFRHHHYLAHNLHRAAKCFVGMVGGEGNWQQAAFTAVLPFPHPTRSGWREHRTVCLPDFQGIGIGNRMSEAVAAMFAATGKPYTSSTSHPAMIRHRANSPLWRMTRKPGLGKPHRNSSGGVRMAATSATTRITAGFEYVGPPATREQARAMGVLDQMKIKITRTARRRPT